MPTTIRPKTKTSKATEPIQVAGSALPSLSFKSSADVLGLSTKIVDEANGIVESLVAVTGNEDDGGDIIEAGSLLLDRWPKVVWSHDLNMPIAKVLAVDEILPGSSELPADLKLKGFGAFRFRSQFDLEDPDSFRAFRKIKFHDDPANPDRGIGWSIGYAVPADGFRMDKGRRRISKVVVWEASPVTFGMNREARTMSVKTASTDEKKGYGPLEGSIEEQQERTRGALEAWASGLLGERGPDNDWWLSVEGTFDDNVVATVRVWGSGQDPQTYRFPMTVDANGDVSLGEPEEVEVVATVVPGGSSGSGSSGKAPEEKDFEPAEAASFAAWALDEIKAGRVLSARNAERLRQAAEALTTVLAEATGKDDEEEKPKTGAEAVETSEVDDEDEDEGHATVETFSVAEIDAMRVLVED